MFRAGVFLITLQLGSGAYWNAYPSDQATMLGALFLVLGVVFLFLGVRIKKRVFSPHNGIKGLASVFVFVTWALSAVVVFWYFDLLSRMGALVPSPISPITYGTAGITFFAILIFAYLRGRTGVKMAVLGAFVGTVVGVMVFELPFLFAIAPQLGVGNVQLALYAEAPLFCLVFASYSLLFLTPDAGFSRYTFFSIGALFVVFSAWAFFTNFSFPSDQTSFAMNAVSKVLGFVTAFTLFSHKGSVTKTQLHS